MISKYLLLVLVLLSISFSNAYIDDIIVDQPRGQIYVGAANFFYEIDDVSLEQNGVHNLTSPINFDSFFVGKSANQAALFAYLDTDTEFGYFKLPIGNQQTLTLKKSISLPPGLSRDNTYDNSDRIAVLSVSRNLTLINLNSLAVLDSFRYYQNRVFGVNLVYNHNNKHLMLFHSRVPYRGDYGLSVSEWDLSTGRFVEVDSSYNCLCGDGYNLTASPFYKVVLDSGNCEINYSSRPARIWCGNGELNQIFSFNAANLSDFFVVHIAGDSWWNVAWDFPNKHAFLLTGNNYDTEGTNFTVSKININTGAILSTYVNYEYNADTSVFALDSDQPHLYIATYDLTEGAPDRIVSLNTNSMSATVVTLNKNLNDP